MPKSGQQWEPEFLLNHPLFTPFEALAAPLRGDSFPSAERLSEYAESMRQLRNPELRSIHFVPLQRKPRRKKRKSIVLEELYDGSIHLRSQVPCLEQSYHDLFNALAFLAFPRSKRILHRRQFEALTTWITEEHRLPGRRTRTQDALTIFDEGGVVLLMSPRYFSCWLKSRTPQPLTSFQAQDGALPLLFGHALLEHLHDERSFIRASAVVLPLATPLQATGDPFEVADEMLSHRLADPLQFQAPGADAIFCYDSGQVMLGPPKPSWAEWVPGDREKLEQDERRIRIG